jgi:rare lipoprotein A
MNNTIPPLANACGSVLSRARKQAVLVAVMTAIATAQDDKPSPVPSRSRKTATVATANPEYKIGTIETGEAVYFSRSMNGRKAAGGDSLDGDTLTAAHALYPFGSIIRVTNTANNRAVELRVIDRISTSSNKLVSVSHAAAEQLEFIKTGSAQVKVQLVALTANR